ncbi:hypothetical protein [Caballeronia ptereochthonis]|uniref:Uncharacterized protein n=1 Tax=Caballeronia ptereochthonis TaxID=1777144 RepID=A0A157ZR74_9BURK|nr:hypothetical protein [Caballeronia ptereochthonis]SAK48024.1 hypothetical protein AWB83_00948 [Caballeronia ptereochthonis]
MNAQVIASLVAMLRAAAASRTLVPYKRLHAKFDECIPLALRYDALEKAASTLADLKTLDYGVLLTLNNGLPGDDFFMRVKRFRRDEYEAVMGYSSTGRSIIKRRMIALPERERVFEHALTNNVKTPPSFAKVHDQSACHTPRANIQDVTLRRQAF